MEISCALAALFFMTGNVVRIVFFAQEMKRNHWDWDTYTALSPDYLETEWDFRLSKQGLWFASGFLNAFGWIMFSYPIIQMAWLLSNRGTKAIMFNIGIAILAIGGAFTEWLSNLFWIGMNVASKKLVLDFNLDEWVRDDISQSDGMGWRALEINHMVGSGFIWFTDAFEWLCLTGLFLFTFCSVRLWRKEDATSFGGRWNGFSLFIGLLCMIEFILEVLRFEGFRSVGPVALLLSAINRLILMPAWIISLGFILPRAMLKQAYTDTNPIAAELALSELSSAVDGEKGLVSPTGNFSIDDDDNEMTGPASPPPEAFARSPPASS